MNGGQDLGGMMGFGPSSPNRTSRFFTPTGRSASLRTAAGALGEWNIDTARHANETLHPVDYLSSSYYEVWLKGFGGAPHRARPGDARGNCSGAGVATGEADPRAPFRRRDGGGFGPGNIL